MTHHVTIYRPAKTTMQSGRAQTKDWVLEYEIETPRRPEPLMGWTSSGDTLNQVRIEFDSPEDAVAFAEKRGWTYTLQKPRERRLRPRNYMDNFKWQTPKKLPPASGEGIPGEQENRTTARD